MANLTADRSLSGVPEFRILVGSSQAALAERVGLSRPTLAKIENGDPTKFSTINFLVTRLQEEYGDLFETIEAIEAEPNVHRLHFIRRDTSPRPEKRGRTFDWGPDLDALSRRVSEAAKPRNAARLPDFHAELLDVLETYVRLTGREIHLSAD